VLIIKFWDHDEAACGEMNVLEKMKDRRAKLSRMKRNKVQAMFESRPLGIPKKQYFQW
jgi:hypothetical protein